MKRFVKMMSLLAAVTVLALSLLTGCGPADPGYQVKVVDALGNPYTEGVVVQFMQNGAAVGMQVVGANGIAAKDLEDGDYTVELTFTDEKATYYYDKSNLALSATNKELTVVLSKTADTEATPLTVSDTQYNAYSVEAGCTYVNLTKNTRNYFLFAPTMAGTYEFSLPGSTATLGYYGAPHFVQQAHAGDEIKDGKFTISIKAGMIGTGNTGTTILVLGIDAGDNENAVLAINRIGEPRWDVSDEPWMTYKTTSELSQYTLPANSTLKEFDLKADKVNLVKDSKGWYHVDSADGPLVVMLLGENSAYLDAFKTDLFLSANEADVQEAINAGVAAGIICSHSNFPIDADAKIDQIRIAFDGDAVIFSDEAEKIYQAEGLEAFAKYQEEHENDILKPGTAFPLVKALHRLNRGEKQLTEIIVMSKNSTSTSMRIFNSIKHYGLNISRAALVSGMSIAPYLTAFKTDLFLSADENDVQEAINAGIAAGMKLNEMIEAGDFTADEAKKYGLIDKIYAKRQ